MTQKKHSKKTTPETVDFSNVPHLFAVYEVETGTKQETRFTFDPSLKYKIVFPVHEKITEFALKEAGIIKQSENYECPTASEFIAGARWNDDPEGICTKQGAVDYGWAMLTKDSDVHPVLYRSHYGDLQFLHSMASADGEPAEQTLKHILQWARFTYAVALRPELGAMQLHAMKEDKFGGIGTFFQTGKSPVTVNDLFLVKPDSHRVAHRAIGSLLHMVQDSFCDSHVDRQNDLEYNVREFHSYANQAFLKHKKADSLIHDKLEDTPKAMKARDWCTAILNLWKEQKPWQEVETLLRDTIYQLVFAPRVAGPGDQYRK